MTRPKDARQSRGVMAGRGPSPAALAAHRAADEPQDDAVPARPSPPKDPQSAGKALWRRLHAGDESRQTNRERHSERATEQREENAFREELSHEPTSLRAERGTHRELASSSSGSREHQIREISTCYYEN